MRRGQLAPVPASAISGTEISDGRLGGALMTSRTKSLVASASDVRYLEQKLVMHGQEHAGARYQHSRVPGYRIIARLMMSAALPWIGALIAARSREGSAGRIAVPMMPLKCTLRPNRVST